MRRARRRNGGARLDEVARLAAVSTATVSRVFNEPAKVSEAVRLRVREAAAALNWIPHAAGRALASSRTHIAGAIIPTLDNEIFARQVGGLQAAFAEAGITLFLGCTNYDRGEGLNQVRAMLARGVEAVAIVGEDHAPELFEALRMRGVPYVVTYSYRAGSPHPCIGFDNRAAFRRITDYVLSLGHRRIAAIFQPLGSNDRVLARLAGLREGLAQAGLALRPGDLRVGPSTMDFGAESFAAIMAGLERPTAVICGNDNLALGALLAANALGLAVPGDVAVTGFDDLALSSRLTPQLTTMWIDNFAIGHRAARHLLAAMGGSAAGDGRTAPLAVELQPELRIRASTGGPDGAMLG